MAELDGIMKSIDAEESPNATDSEEGNDEEGPSTSSTPAAQVVSIDSQAQTSLGAAEAATPTLYEHLWDVAYEAIKNEYPGIVARYEEILSSSLRSAATPSSPSSETDSHFRRVQMAELVDDWFGKVNDEESQDSDDSEVEAGQRIHSIRHIIRGAMDDAPGAVLAWAGACFASEIILNPQSANKEDCSGLIYIISRMGWYSCLPGVLNQDLNKQSGLRNRIVDLYRAILSYEMKVVCSQRNSLAFDIPAKFLKSRMWTAGLKMVSEAEAALAVFNESKVKLPLERLAETASKEKPGYARRAEELPHEEDRPLDDLHVADPRPDILRFSESESEAMKELYGGLSRSQPFMDFRDWDRPDSQLIWISGDAGQGKTMLLTAAVRELCGQPYKRGDESSGSCTSFFFFDHVKPESNNAATALKNLIWLVLAQQEESLADRLKDKRRDLGRKYFDSPSDFLALAGLFHDITQDSNFQKTYFVVDALDECSSEKGQPGLCDFLRLITASMTWPRREVRWLVSVEALDQFKPAFEGHGYHHLILGSSLEISPAAISGYVEKQVSELADEKSYDQELREQVLTLLCERSRGNYLWINLVCAALRAEETWDALTFLEEVRELDSPWALYGRMENQLDNLPRRDGKFCKHILTVMATVERSLRVEELRALVRLAPRVSLEKILEKCTAFLQNRDGVVSFSHELARGYVRQKMLGPDLALQMHSSLTQNCLESLANALRSTPREGRTVATQNAYSQEQEDARVPGDYVSLFWIVHLLKLCDGVGKDDIREKVIWFLENYLLGWVEYLDSRGQLSTAANLLQKVDLCLNVKGNNKDKLCAILRESHQLLRFHQSTNSPAGISAYNTLLFCPTSSTTRKRWLSKAFQWIKTPPIPSQHWGSEFRALQCHSDWIRALAFSPDGRLIASGSDDSTVRIWDAASGTMQHQLALGRGWVYCVAMSREFVAAGSDDLSITIWDCFTGRQLGRLKDQPGILNSLSFSPDGTMLAAASANNLRIWERDGEDWTSRDLEGDEDGGCVTSVDFAGDGKRLVASASAKGRIWDVERRSLLLVLDGHSEQINSIVFSHDMKSVASGSDDGICIVWDASSGAPSLTLNCDNNSINSVAFSFDGGRVACGTDHSIHIWNTATGVKQVTMQSRTFNVRSVAFSPPEGAYLASASFDGGIHLWYAPRESDCATADQPQQQQEEQPPLQAPAGAVSEMAVTPDGRTIATDGGDLDSSYYRGWVWELDAAARSSSPRLMCFQFDHTVYSLQFSPDGRSLLATSSDRTARICDVSTGEEQRVFRGHADWVRSAAWSPDGRLVATASDDGSVRVWEVSDGGDVVVLAGEHDDSWVQTVAFAPDGLHLVSADSSKAIIWERQGDGAGWQKTHTLGDAGIAMAFSLDSRRLLSVSSGTTLLDWELETESYKEPPAKIRQLYSRIWFDQDPQRSDFVMTPLGAQAVGLASAPSESPSWCPYYLLYDGEAEQWWIMHHDKKVIFLPASFSPDASCVIGHRVFVGRASGHVLVFDFSAHHPSRSMSFRM